MIASIADWGGEEVVMWGRYTILFSASVIGPISYHTTCTRAHTLSFNLSEASGMTEATMTYNWLYGKPGALIPHESPVYLYANDCVRTGNASTRYESFPRPLSSMARPALSTCVLCLPYLLSTKHNTHVFGTFRIARCLMKTAISIPLPVSPAMNIMPKMIGTMYVSGRYL